MSALGEAACAVAVRVMAVPDDLATQRLSIGRDLVVHSPSMTRLAGFHPVVETRWRLPVAN